MKNASCIFFHVTVLQFFVIMMNGYIFRGSNSAMFAELLPLKMYPFTFKNVMKQDLWQGQDSSPDSALPIT